MMHGTKPRQFQFEIDLTPPSSGAQYKASRGARHKGMVGESYTAATGSDAFMFTGAKQLEARIGQTWSKSYSWAYASLGRIARDVAALPFVIRPANDTEADPIETGPLYELLSRPNPLKTATRMRKRVLLHTLAAGNGFWLLDSGTPNFAGMVKEIWPLQPEYMRPVPSKETILAGWMYDPGLGGSTFIPREAVVHFSIEDPQDLIMGMSLMEPMAEAVQSSLAAMKWNRKFFEKDATPSSVVIKVPDTLSDDNYKRLRHQLAESHTGLDNAWEPLLLEGGMELDAFNHSHTEMGFESLLRLDREQAMAVAGVPPAIAGDWREMNFAQSAAQLELYWISTCIPVSRDMCDTINTFMVPRVQPGVQVSQDFSGVKVLQPDKAAELAYKSARIQAGLATPNQILEDEGRDADKYPEGDRYYMTAGMVPVDQLGRSEPVELFSVGDGQLTEKAAALDETMKSLARRATYGRFHQRLSKHERKIQRAWQDEIKRVIKFVENRLRVSRAAPKAGMMGDGVRKDGVPDRPPRLVLPLPVHEYMPIADDLNAQITTRLRLVHLDLIEEFGQVAAREITSAAVFDSGGPAVLEMVERAESQIERATFNLLNDLRETLNEGMDEGESIGSLVNRIKGDLEGKGGVARAQRIARTESASTANSAQFEGYRQQGVKELRWISVIDEFTRDGNPSGPDHRSRDGETWTAGERFPDTDLLWPGDPNGSAAEIINCRCTHEAVIQEQAAAA